MSFATSEDVINCVEGLIRRLWSALLDIELPPGPFPTLSYEDAMAAYGSDKPDVRLGMKVSLYCHSLQNLCIARLTTVTDRAYRTHDTC